MKCMVKGCEIGEGLLDPVIIVPTKVPNLVGLAYRLIDFPLCLEHSNNVRTPYEFFIQKPQLVRRMLRRSYPSKAELDFEEMCLRFEPTQTNEANIQEPIERTIESPKCQSGETSPIQ